MQEQGQKTKLGQEIRLADIDIDQSEHGIFDCIDFAEDGAKQSIELAKRLNQSYGVAGIAWLEYLIKNDITATAHQLTEQFTANYPNLDGQAGRVAKRFALVAVAGELATQAGITGWQAGQATEAVRACLDNWLGNYGDIGNHETRQILKQVQGFLQVHKHNRFTDWFAQYTDRLPNRAGFYRPDTDSFYIFPVIFENEVCKGYSKKQVAVILDILGLLEKNHGYMKKVNNSNQDKKGNFYCIKGSIIEATP